MTKARANLARSAPRRGGSGILPSQAIEGLIAEGQVKLVEPLLEKQLQSASLDLRLGTVAYRVRASFLPGEGYTVKDKIDLFGMHKIDLAGGAEIGRAHV